MLVKPLDGYCRLRNERGQTMINAMIAIGLIGLLALLSSTAVSFISNALRRNDHLSRLMELDMDIANLLAIPQECSCNFLQDASGNSISFSNDTSTFSLKTLQFYSDPPTCSKSNPVVAVGQVHSASGLTVTGIQLGPFHPLGKSGTYLAELTVSADGLQTPYQSKVLLNTSSNSSGSTHTVKYCGMHLGSAPTTGLDDSAPAASLKGFYRYSQFSLNFACPNLPNSPQGTPVSLHPRQTEPYVFTRVQYFWPRQEGDYLTDYETARTAGTVMAPVSFSAFYGTSVCYELDGQGDAIRLIVPSYNAKNCAKVKQQFLAGTTVVDVGFSVIDNCRSRFF